MLKSIKNGSTILFQGDSITDAGRDYSDVKSFGAGYVNAIVSGFTAAFPQLDVNFINKGVSGNRAIDLVNRWSEDTIAVKPDLLTILIGINDCWRRYDQNDPTCVDTFYKNYKTILERTRNESDCEIILMEPFLLPVMEGQVAWREDLDPKIQATRTLAREFKTHFIPLDGIFAAASAYKPLDIWLADGVHTNNAGASLIANEWIKLISK